jgi:hypothetical protein
VVVEVGVLLRGPVAVLLLLLRLASSHRNPDSPIQQFPHQTRSHKKTIPSQPGILYMHCWILVKVPIVISRERKGHWMYQVLTSTLLEMQALLLPRQVCNRPVSKSPWSCGDRGAGLRTLNAEAEEAFMLKCWGGIF